MPNFTDNIDVLSVENVSLQRFVREMYYDYYYYYYLLIKREDSIPRGEKLRLNGVELAFNVKRLKEGERRMVIEIETGRE